jgi:hypothetical protein
MVALLKTFLVIQFSVNPVDLVWCMCASTDHGEKDKKKPVPFPAACYLLAAVSKEIKRAASITLLPYSSTS